MTLEINNLCKSFAGSVALDRINLSVKDNEFVCLLGPSGCGKTTLLRIIAGLLTPDSGEMRLGERNLATVPTRERGFGIVFQSYSLFPNMTAAENVGYGLKIRKRPKHEISQRAAKMLALVKLGNLADRMPYQLSGGQQQRVALARALAVDPTLILLDEPLSALDAKVRADLRQEIRDVHRRLGIPIIMVTHDQEEALMLSDKVVCMNYGRIEQIGTPEDLYLRPSTRFVADFMGRSNLVPTEWVRQALPQLLASRPPGADDHIEACIRPERLSITPTQAGSGVIREVTFLGNISQLRLDWRGREWLAETASMSGLAVGMPVEVDVAATDCVWVRS
jgi:iron(III) transport system ATP-binding protein